MISLTQPCNATPFWKLLDEPKPERVLAYRDGDHLIVFHCDKSVEFSHVEITTDPPADEWIYEPDGNYYRGKTTADKGNIFYVICAENSCIPHEVDFKLFNTELYDWNVTLKDRQVNKGGCFPPMWFRYVQLAVGVIGLSLAIYVLWRQFVR